MPRPKIDPEQIHKALGLGEPPKSIAARLGVSVRRVYQIRGVAAPREKLSDVDRMEIAAELARGASQRDIAAARNLSRRTVSEIAKEHDVAATVGTRQQLAPDVVAHILARKRAGREPGTIASETGLSKSTIRAVIRRNDDSAIAPDDTLMRAWKEEMRLRGLQITDLVQLLGGVPTRERLYEYWRGDRTPTTPVMSRILAALGIGLVRSTGDPIG